MRAVVPINTWLLTLKCWGVYSKTCWQAKTPIPKKWRTSVSFGAFYTPREIVDYMVNESLRASLESKLLPEMPKELNVANEPMAEYRGTLFQDAAPKQIPISYSDESTKADIERRRERWKTKLVKLLPSIAPIIL